MKITKEIAQDRVNNLKDFKDSIIWDSFKNFSVKKVDVNCHKCNNLYKVTLKNLVNGSRCLDCSYKERTKKLVKDIDSKSLKILKDKNFEIKDFKGKSLKNKFSCTRCKHEFSCSTKLAVSKKFSCPKCGIDSVKVTDKLKDKVSNYQKRLDEMDINIKINVDKFHGTLKYSNFKCMECYNYFNGYLNNIFVNKKSLCPFCDNLNGKHDKSYYENLLNDENYNIFLEGETSCHEKVEVLHKKCGARFTKRLSDLVYNKQMCPKCVKSEKTLLGVENIKVKINELGFSILNDDNLFNTTSLINVKCRRCSNVMEGVPVKYILNGKRCRNCSRKMSNGEKRIFEFLTKNNIEFEFQYPIKTGATYQFLDFFIPDKNIAIEYDGEHHFIPIEHFGGTEYLNYTINNDKRKEFYCEEKGYDLIRIKYSDFKLIENILMERCMR